jgi:hypothetical protein
MGWPLMSRKASASTGGAPSITLPDPLNDLHQHPAVSSGDAPGDAHSSRATNGRKDNNKACRCR